MFGTLSGIINGIIGDRPMSCEEFCWKMHGIIHGLIDGIMNTKGDISWICTDILTIKGKQANSCTDYPY